MSNQQPWADRRGLAHVGREKHEPVSPTGRKFSETGVVNAVRRASTSSNGGAASPPAAKSPMTAGAAYPTPQGRRRSSAASGGMFSNLTNAKRGSEDYSERRASHQDMAGGGGVLSGWFGQTFKGHPKAAAEGKDGKRGVME